MHVFSLVTVKMSKYTKSARKHSGFLPLAPTIIHFLPKSPTFCPFSVATARLGGEPLFTSVWQKPVNSPLGKYVLIALIEVGRPQVISLAVSTLTQWSHPALEYTLETKG